MPGVESILPFGCQLKQRDGAIFTPMISHQLEAKPLSDMFANLLWTLVDYSCLRDGFEDHAHVADGYLFVQQEAQHREKLIHRNLVGHQFIDHALVRC